MEAFGGPYLNAAVLCQQVIESKDGSLSLIRIVDRLVQTAAGPNPPETMPPIEAPLFLVLMFKSGAARGSHVVKVQPEGPSGIKLSPITLPALFEGEDRGVNLINQLTLRLSEEGLHWIDISVDDRLVTRVPIRVVYQRIGFGSPPTN